MIDLAWSDAILGDPRRGEAEAIEARDHFAALGHRNQVRRALNALGAARYHLGKYREATEALSIANDLAPTEHPGWVPVCNHAMGRALLGEVEAADSEVSALADVDSPMFYMCRGWVAEMRGDLPRARTALDRAKQLIGTNHGFEPVFVLWRSGAVFERAGDLTSARRDLEAAIADPTEMGILAAQARIVLARVTLREGDAQVAEVQARQGIDALTRGGSTASVGFGYAVVIEARLARGDRDGARAALADAERIRPTLQNPAELAALDAAAERLQH